MHSQVDFGAIESRPKLAVVVPCFNEQEILPHTAAALCQLLENYTKDGLISSGSYILFVDDGSEDNTWIGIEALFAENRPIKALKLSRNYGRQAALLAGLDSVQFDVSSPGSP